MAAKKLLIADGHHRYETALAIARTIRSSKDAGTGDDDVRQHELPGSEDPGNAPDSERAGRIFGRMKYWQSACQELCPWQNWNVCLPNPAPDRVRMGMAVQDCRRIYLLDRKRQAGELDVRVLHEELLAGPADQSGGRTG